MPGDVAAPDQDPPQVTITTAISDTTGTSTSTNTTTLLDTGHVLDTGGRDIGGNPCGQNEAQQWRPIGTAGLNSLGADLTLSPAQTVQHTRLDTTVTAHP